jgi:hypothetical protein
MVQHPDADKYIAEKQESSERCAGFKLIFDKTKKQECRK